MNRAIGTIAALLIAIGTFTGSAFAGDPGDPDAICDGSTSEMVECLNAKTMYWDKRLTVAYQAALKDAAPKQREQLRVAQRLWIQYRDANCLYYAMGEGTIARIEAGECTRKMTEDRARELDGSSEKK